MVLSIGQRVRIDMEEGHPEANDEMYEEFYGAEATIIRLANANGGTQYYHLDIDDGSWFWSEDMFKVLDMKLDKRLEVLV